MPQFRWRSPPSQVTTTLTTWWFSVIFRMAHASSLQAGQCANDSPLTLSLLSRLTNCTQAAGTRRVSSAPNWGASPKEIRRTLCKVKYNTHGIKKEASKYKQPRNNVLKTLWLSGYYWWQSVASHATFHSSSFSKLNTEENCSDWYYYCLLTIFGNVHFWGCPRSLFKQNVFQKPVSQAGRPTCEPTRP